MNYLVIALMILLFSEASFAENSDTLLATPGEFWHAAMDESPIIQASSISVQAAEANFSASGRLPDPMVRIGYAPEPLETRNGPVDYSITLSQKIPWPGTLSSSRREMELMHESSTIEHTIASLGLRTRVTRLWSRMYITRCSIDLLNDELYRIEGLRQVADVRYRSGQLNLESILQLENRQAVLETRIETEELEFRSALEELQGIIGVQQISLSWPDSIPEPSYFASLVSAEPKPDSMPSVRRMQVLADSREASADAVRASLYPGFEIGVSWSVIGEPSVDMGAVDPGRDGLMVFAGMSLPLGYSGSREWSSAAAMDHSAAVYLQMQAENEQLAAREGLLNHLQSSMQQLQTYSDVLIPNNEAICELSVNEWISGTMDIKQVIENMNDLRSVRLEERRIYGEIVITCAQLLELDGTTTEEGEFL